MINNLLDEIWKPVVGYETYYEVSNQGRVRNARTKKLKSICNGSKGYKQVNISVYKEECTIRVHRLVAGAFIANPENKPEVNHINSKRDDNRADNLEWVTRKEQIAHAIKYGNMLKSNRSRRKGPNGEYIKSNT